MTVAELIANLQAFNPNSTVNVWSPDEDDLEGLVLKPVSLVETNEGEIVIT